MRLQPVKIKSTDFPEDQKKIAEAIGDTLNPFIDKLVIGFTKNLTVDENLPFEFKVIDVVVDGTGTPLTGGVIQPYNLSTGLNGFKGYLCVNATDLTGGNNYPSHTPFLATTTINKTVTVHKITGLTANILYRLVLLGIS